MTFLDTEPDDPDSIKKVSTMVQSQGSHRDNADILVKRKTTGLTLSSNKKSVKAPSQAEIDQFFNLECSFACSPSAIRAAQMKKINKYQETLRKPPAPGGDNMAMSRTTTSMFDDAALGRSNMM